MTTQADQAEMQSTPMNQSAQGGSVRFLKTNVKGAKPTPLIGKGSLLLDADSIRIDGKKLLSFGYQVLIFILVIVVASFIEIALFSVSPLFLVLFFVPNVIFALIADLLAREAVFLVIDAASIEKISQRRGTATFLIVFNTGGGKAAFIAFKFVEQQSATAFMEKFDKIIRQDKFSVSSTL
ncbi:MAG: hypothetical protein P9M14_03855 [Candidatus Alcyoniella australis]|nr:hypothetical protein [Candidatus Alcyoniella australis]